MSLDSDTIKIYEELKIAARDGDLLSYAGKLARSMMGQTPMVEARLPIPPPRMMNESAVDAHRRTVGEGIRVSNL